MVIILAVMVVIIMIFFSCQSSCVKNSCINIATCQSGFTVRGHWCVCPAGLKGYNCDEGKWHLRFCFLVWKHWWTKVDFLTELAIWYAETWRLSKNISGKSFVFYGAHWGLQHRNHVDVLVRCSCKWSRYRELVIILYFRIWQLSHKQ